MLHDTSGLFDVLCSLGLVPVGEPALHSLLMSPPDARAEAQRSPADRELEIELETGEGEQTLGEPPAREDTATALPPSYAYPLLLDGRVMGVLVFRAAPLLIL